jgi:hypothetical protein
MAPQKYDPSYVPTMAAADIERFNLNDDTFHETLKWRYKRSFITDDAAYYIRVEGSFDSFVLEAGQEVPDIPGEERQTVGTKGHPCSVCRDIGT